MNVATLVFIIISLLLFVILLLRGSSNRTGIQRDNDSADKLRDSVEQSRARDQELKQSSDNIAETNRDARTNISRAKEILKRAKNRGDSKQDI